MSETIRAARISVEDLLRWAFAPGRQDGVAWRVDSALAFDRGLTVKPRRRGRGSWLLVEAGAARLRARRPALRITATSDADAESVAGAVAGLSNEAAELVRRHARGRSRPDWLDTETRLERVLLPNGKPVIAYSNNRHRTVPYCPLRLVIDRVLTLASIRRWQLWREGLALLGEGLSGSLDRWEINGYLPPAEPWRPGHPTPGGGDLAPRHDPPPPCSTGENS